MIFWSRWLKHVKRNLSRQNSRPKRSQKRAARKLTVEHLEVRVVPSAAVLTDKPDYAPGQTAIINGSGFQAGETVQLQVLRTDGVPDYPEGNQPWQVVDGVGGFAAYKDDAGTWHYPDLDGQADGNIQTTWYVESQYAGASLELTATGLTSHEVATAEFTDGFGLSQLHLDNNGVSGGNKRFDTNSTDPEDYVFTVGNTIVPVGAVENNKFYDIVVTDPTGAARVLFSRRPTGQFDDVTTDNSYTILANDPVSTSKPWKFTLREFDTANTNTVLKSSTKTFYVAKPTVYNSSALTTQQSSFGAGTTAFVTVVGLQPAKGDWSTTWTLPGGTVAAANTGGGDRPASNTSGVLAVGNKSTSVRTFLQYAPRAANTGTDQWNWVSKYETKPSVANSTFNSGNQGTWTLTLQADNKHFVKFNIFTVDTTAPAAPAVTSPPSPISINVPTNAPYFVIQGTAEANALVKVYSGTTVVGSVQLSGGATAFAIPVTLTENAANNFTVTATDAAGNQSTAATVPTITEISTPTTVPIVTSPSVPVTVNADFSTITGTAEAGSLVTVWRDNNNNGVVDAGDDNLVSQTLAAGATGFTFNNVPLIQNTVNSFLVTAKGSTNPNVSQGAYVPPITEDSIAPAAPVVTNPSGAVVVGTTQYTITGTAEAGSVVNVWLDANNDGVKDNASPLDSTVADSDGNFSVTVSLNSNPNGSAVDNNFVVTATDAAGNESATADVPTITENATVPTVTDPLFDITVNAASYTIQGTAAVGSTVTIYRDKTPPDGVLDNSDPQVGSPQLVGSDGLFAISVPLTQNAANYFLVQASNTPDDIAPVPVITADSIAPVAPSTPVLDPSSDTGATNNITADNTPLFTGTAEAFSTVTVYDGTTPVGSDVADDTGAWSVVVTTPLSDGVRSITAKATDDANNTGLASAALSVTIDTQTVLTVSPASGTYGGTTTLQATLAWHGENLALSGETIAFTINSFSVGTATTNNSGIATLSNVSLAGINAGSYTGYIGAGFAGDTVDNFTYNSSSGSGSLTISQRVLHVSATGVNKVYDGTTAATVNLSDDRVSGDVFTDSYTSASFANKNVATGKTVTVSGISISGTAAGNYTLNGVTTASTTANITARALTVSATGINKVYDGTTAATVTLSDNRVSGDVFTDSYTSATFADKNVGTAKPVSISGISISGTDAGNYTFNTTASTTADITARALTVSATGVNKVYDGGTVATVTLSDNRVAGDVFTDSYTSASFADKNVGTGKTVSVTGISISGTDAGNYALQNTTASATANITPYALTVSATGINRVYDTTTAATVTLADNHLGSDVVVDAYTSASFADKNVATGKTVSVTGISISGTDAGNYALQNTTASTTANITPYALTVSATGINRVYDTTTAATVTLADNHLGSDVVVDAYTSASFADKNVANGKTVSVTGISISGTDAGNYALQNTTASATANITPAPLTVSATGINRVYDTTTAATVTLADNHLGSDVVVDAYTSASFADKNVATGKTVSVTGISISGTDAGNYALQNTTASATANITPAPLTVSATGINRVYDTTTAATVTLADNHLGSDVVVDAYTSASFADKNVANGKAVSVSGISISGTDAGNYALQNTTASATANITPAPLTVSATGINRVYDTTTAATVTLADNHLGSDVVVDAYTSASFADKNVANGKTVSVTGISISGTDAGNYALQNTTASATANITPAPLTVSATGINRVYDTTTAATVTLADNHLGSDVVVDAYTSASFADKNVATGKTVSVTGISISGTDAGNYALQNTTASTTANITPYALTVSATGINRVYDTTTAATVTLADNHLGSDVVVDAYTSASFADKNVANGKAVSVSGISISGTDAGNYALQNTTASATANITPAPLTVSATGINRVYDTTTAATVTLADNHLGSDVVVDAYTSASFADKNVGTGKTVTVSGISISGTDAGNYTFNTTASTTADITKLGLTVSAHGVNKVYDGTTTATVTLSDNRVSGDVFTDSYTSASFADSNVGTGKTVTVTGISISGTDAGNYSFNTSTTTTADITPAGTQSSIAANFNGTAIPAGDTIWFNSVLKVSGLSSTSPTTIQFVGQTITVNGTTYPAPNATITFSPTATSAKTIFNTATNTWETTVPSSGLSGNQFLSGFALPLPNGLPGGIKNVTWSGNFLAPSGVSVSWKWAAAVYTNAGFSSDYNALGVKPVDDNHVTLLTGPNGTTSLAQNSDHAGTPEYDKQYVTAGATGGGASNYTGGYSGTKSQGSFQLADGSTSDYVSSASNQVLNGVLTVSAQDDTGNGLDANELNRLNEAMSYLNDALGSFGVSLSWAAAGTDADVHVHFATMTPHGGMSDGVLGFTTVENDVYLVTGWNFYTGDDPTQIGSNQFDFLTLATHELAHTVALGESIDPDSVMYEYLSPGTVRRTFTDSNLTLINTDSDRYMKVAENGPVPQVVAGTSPLADSARLSLDAQRLGSDTGLSSNLPSVTDPDGGHDALTATVGTSAPAGNAGLGLDSRRLLSDAGQLVDAGLSGNPLQPTLNFTEASASSRPSGFGAFVLTATDGMARPFSENLNQAVWTNTFSVGREGMIIAAAEQHQTAANERKPERSPVSEPAAESWDVLDQVFRNWQGPETGNADASGMLPESYPGSAMLLAALVGTGMLRQDKSVKEEPQEGTKPRFPRCKR